MPNPRRLAGLSLAAAAALIVLAACAPAIQVRGSGTHHGASSTAPTATASAPATAKPIALAPPKIRVPLTCNQIAPAAQVTSVLAAPEVLSNQEPTKGNDWLASDLEPYGYVQDGALVCQYETAASSDLTFYRAYVMPDASQALWAPYFAMQSAPSSFTISPSPFGAKSYLICEGSYHELDCDLEDMIGSTWVSLYGYSDDGPVLTVAQAAARFTPLFTTAVNAIKNATIAEPAWTDPAATAVNLSTDYTSLDAALSTAIGQTVTIQSYEYGPEISESTDDALIPVRFDDYTDYIGSTDNLNIKVLPGGAWAWAAVTAAASADPNYAAISGLGDKAISFSMNGQNGNPYQVAVVVAKGHNLFSVEVDTTTATSAAGLLSAAKAAAGVLASDIGAS
jgi:hypothetical protein